MVTTLSDFKRKISLEMARCVLLRGRVGDYRLSPQGVLSSPSLLTLL